MFLGSLFLSAKEVRQLGGKGSAIFELALPDDKDAPAPLLQQTQVHCIAFNRVVELAIPKVLIGGGSCRSGTVGVTMPEAAVDKNYLASRWEDDVGAAW